jgi:hypothetical protein
MNEATNSTESEDNTEYERSALLISLLKGVLYRDDDGSLWQALISQQARLRDYVSVLGLALILDEAEGYAFLRGRPDSPDDSAPKLPRLIARRPLSFPVSLLLALLRRKLAEFDAGGDQTRLIMSRGEIADLIRVFLPDNSNEARLIDQIDTHINKVVELGFLRKLKGNTAVDTENEANFEVRRILKAFVDAQWLAEFDERLAGYKAQLAEDS